MMTARDVVYATLVRWNLLSNPPFLPERSEETWKHLNNRDRAFAFDLLTGVLRWRGTLDRLITWQARRPSESLDHRVLTLLWMGSYQLIFQGGTAAYAAVDTTVELAKQHPDTDRAAGLINAVLRGMTRMQPKLEKAAFPGEGDVMKTVSRKGMWVDFETKLTFAVDVFPDPVRSLDGNLAAARSHPEAFVTWLRNTHGESAANAILLRNNVRPMISLRTDGSVVPEEAGLAPHDVDKNYVVAMDGWNTPIEGAVQNGVLSPQDPTAGKVVRVLKGVAGSPMRVLDLCAGLGTKALQLAKAFPDAEIVATDVDAAKLEKLLQRAKHIGQKNVKTMVIAEALKLEGGFDVVLADVPCSNTGVMGKRVQSRWRWATLDRGAQRTLQMKLLEQALMLTRSGGLAAYSTCSIDPTENGVLVDGYLAEKGGGKVSRVRDEATMPSVNASPNGMVDGGYFSILKKS